MEMTPEPPTRALAIASSQELAVLPIEVATIFAIEPAKAQALIAKHGYEAVQCALEIKKDKLDISLPYFLQTCEQTGLSPQVVADLYQAREDIIGEEVRGKNGRYKNESTIRGMSKLALFFEDFRDAPYDDKTEMVISCLRIYSGATFRKMVDAVIARADELGIRSLEEFNEIIAEYQNKALEMMFCGQYDEEEG